MKMKKFNRCVIISGGPEPLDFKILPDDFIIACDKGHAYAIEKGLIPHLFVGDGDSYHGIIHPPTEHLRLPAEKDDTDTLFAAKHAAKLGFDDFIILCGLGGRLDHTLANLSVCTWLAKQGKSVCMYGKNETVFATGSALSIKREEGFSLSLFAVEKCKGVTLKGVKYPLENAVLTPDFPLGVSNEFDANIANLTIKSGICLVVLSRLDRYSGGIK